MKPALEIMFIYEPAREGGKAVFQKVGALWPSKNGQGYSGTMQLNGVNVRVMVAPPRDTEQEPRQVSKPAAAMPVLDDSLPF